MKIYDEEKAKQIRTGVASKAYQENWERIFGGENTEDPVDAPLPRACNGLYEAGSRRCENREGCGLEGCPAADFGITTER